MIKRLMLESYIDLSTVGQIEYEWDFDDEEYQEWLNDENREDNQESRQIYIDDNVQFEITYLDNETYHYMDSEYMYYSDLEDTFGENAAKNILNDCIKRGNGKMETYELYADETYDINNPDELNAIAVKLLQHGEYYKNCRGFILTNGEVVYTPAEHNECTIIDGVKGTFHFIKLGNIRVLQNSIDLSKQPTQEQKDVLRKVISCYEGETLYLDIITDKGECSAAYQNPDYRRVIGEIDRYFREGIEPQGGYNFNEHKLRKKSLYNLNGVYIGNTTILKEKSIRNEINRLNENCGRLNQFCVRGGADDFDLWNTDTKIAHYYYTDKDAYPVLILDNKTYIGSQGEKHKDIICRIHGYKGYDDFVRQYLNNHPQDNEYDADDEYQSLKEKFEDDFPDYIDGRIWIEPHCDSFKYSILYFWGLMGHESLKIYKSNVQYIANKFGIDTNKLMIAVSEQDDDWNATLVSFNDWAGIVGKMSKEQEELKNIHNLPPEEKWKSTEGYRDIINHKIGQKLTNDKGAEMPKAKYNSMIYQEGKCERKKNTRGLSCIR